MDMPSKLSLILIDQIVISLTNFHAFKTILAVICFTEALLMRYLTFKVRIYDNFDEILCLTE